MQDCGRICRVNSFFNWRCQKINKSMFVTYRLASFLSKFIEQHHRVLIWWGWWVKALHLWTPISEVPSIPCGKSLFRFHRFSTSSTKSTLLKPAIRFCNKKTANDYPVFNFNIYGIPLGTIGENQVKSAQNKNRQQTSLDSIYIQHQAIFKQTQKVSHKSTNI